MSKALFESFSEENTRFFSSVTNASQARIRAKYRYDVARMPDDKANLEKHKLYVEMFGNDLQYTFINSSGERVVDIVESSNFTNGFNIDQLTIANIKTIMQIASKRGHTGYHFVAEHRDLIEQKFTDLYATLPNDKDTYKNYWLDCYFCCVTLEEFYGVDGYPDPNKAKMYHELRKELEYKLESMELPLLSINNHAKPTIFSLQGIALTLTNGVNDLVDTFQHTSAIRGWLGFTNLYRILFLFSRLAVKQAFLLAHQLKWLDSLGQLLNHVFDVNIFVSMINAPTGIFNALSVGIFEVRLFIMICEMLKHVIAPTEKERSRSRSARLNHELKIRLVDLYNDIAWATVNTLCNYGYLAGPVADWLTAGFLLLDAAALLVSYGLNHSDYKFKREQYEKELALASSNLIGKKIVEDKLRQLDDAWGALEAKLMFATGAALVLMTGFSATLLLTGPAVATASFVFCTFGVAMYLSSGKFGEYTRASLALQGLENQALQDAQNKANAAYSAFLGSLAKNSIMPLVVVTAYAVFWPAALVLAAAYVAYENKSERVETKNLPEWTPTASTREELDDREFEAVFPGVCITGDVFSLSPR